MITPHGGIRLLIHALDTYCMLWSVMMIFWYSKAHTLTSWCVRLQHHLHPTAGEQLRITYTVPTHIHQTNGALSPSGLCKCSPSALRFTHVYHGDLLLKWINFNPCHDDVIKWKHFPRYWPFVRGIHRSR